MTTTNGRPAASRPVTESRRPIPDGYLEQWYWFVGASLLSSTVGWGMSYLGAYYPVVDRELIKVQLTLSILVTLLLITLASSIVTLHAAWLRNESQHRVELGVLKRMGPTLYELGTRACVCFVVVCGVMILAWCLGMIDMPLSLAFVAGLSVATASWTKAWADAGDEKLLAVLDGRDGLANWLEHHPGRPAARRGTWRAYELMLQLPVDYTRLRVFSGCLAGVSFSLAWGFGDQATTFGVITTILIPATVSVMALSGLVVTLGLAIWREHAISLREGHEQWQQQVDEIAGSDAEDRHPACISENGLT